MSSNERLMMVKADSTHRYLGCMVSYHYTSAGMYGELPPPVLARGLKWLHDSCVIL